MNQFKINPADIAEHGSIERVITEYSCPAIADSARDQKLTVRFTALPAGSEILVRGDISGTLTLDCSRCLTVYSYPVSIKITQSYPASSAEIDVEDEVRQLLVLNLPSKPLCKEACAGICPQCGRNLNTGKCTCEVTHGDNRWEKLKDLIK
jgi:uncharacterized protein